MTLLTTMSFLIMPLPSWHPKCVNAAVGTGEAAIQKAAEVVAQQLNVTKESVLPACLIADVELAFQGRSLLQDDDEDWDNGINSRLLHVWMSRMWQHTPTHAMACLQ